MLVFFWPLGVSIWPIFIWLLLHLGLIERILAEEVLGVLAGVQPWNWLGQLWQFFLFFLVVSFTQKRIRIFFLHVTFHSFQKIDNSRISDNSFLIYLAILNICWNLNIHRIIPLQTTLSRYCILLLHQCSQLLFLCFSKDVHLSISFIYWQIWQDSDIFGKILTPNCDI